MNANNKPVSAATQNARFKSTSIRQHLQERFQESINNGFMEMWTIPAMRTNQFQLQPNALDKS
jgi:hypothetical protein